MVGTKEGVEDKEYIRGAHSKQVFYSSVFGENDIKALISQLVELLEGQTPIVQRGDPQGVLCDHDPLKTSADADEAQDARNVAPQDARSHRSKA